ncbi:K02A2.6-like [Cordylochernes scorpioides]|uniref:K02A2.6-like n=1 Tax=Cordylochernes scorpioides TaxID=51811 RepID=A0ABY6KW84_9ARAC|nr:K02A2.6-like [Cordylochernes scorpioides]
MSLAVTYTTPNAVGDLGGCSRYRTQLHRPIDNPAVRSQGLDDVYLPHCDRQVPEDDLLSLPSVWECPEEGVVDDAFRGVFRLQEDSARRAEKVLKSRAQKADEPSESYIQEILSVGQQVNPRMKEGQIVAHIIKGISEDTYQVLVAKDIQTVDEILKFTRHLATIKQRWIGRTKFGRLSNVMPNSYVDDSFDSAGLIRSIDGNFEDILNEVEAVAWKSFRNVCKNILGNVKVENYSHLVNERLFSHKALGCNMSLKIHIMHSHLDFIPEKLGAVSDEYGERFHPDISTWKSGFKVNGVPVCLLTTSGHSRRMCHKKSKEAYNIFEHLDLSDEQRNNSDEIINALTQHFTPKINIIYERSIFNQTNQETNESIEQYICRLRKLSSTCNYDAMTEEMIRDRLVLGIIDKQTKRQLISDPQLTLQKAIDVCKANESANKQIENSTKNTQEEVNKLNIRKKTVNQNKMKKNIPCRYCATFHEHNRQKCPAWNQTCRKCNKNNHWAKVCKSRMRTVQSLESQNSNDEQEDCYSLVYVSEISARKLMTKLELELNGYKESIICQIDTGATVNVLNFADLCKIMQDGNPSLKPSYIKLRCYGGEILKPRGQIKINCSHQSKQHPIVFQVIDHWEKPILSAETCQKLNLIEIKADLCKIEFTWTKQNNLLDKYKDIFEGIGCLQGEYKLETDPTIKPIKQAPRRVPITLRKELKEKLIDMEKKNIIAKVDYPTDWISNLVLVKSTKKLRICIDPRELNVALKRAEYPIPTIEEIIPNLQNAKIFTVVDTKDGFWNVKLSDESSNLTTFWTPFGRYKFLRMPFGLKTASEEYQRRLYEIFQGLEGIEIIADDILILGKGDSYEEALKDHDRNLENLFKTARQANLKFNINKVKLRLKEVKYLGHIITPHGLKPDPEKVKALKEMPHPESITELKSFLGFATYLCKFMPNISMISEPLRKLTMKNSTWSWSKNHQAAFEQIKDLASKAPILRYFDADKSIAIQCDASKHGLGATLLQESQPIIFASRSLSKTEQNYAQIEKECLAIVFACERFHQYILGKCQVIVQTDHKPLLSIFKKSILKAPQRLQRMLLRLQRYNLELEHVQGSQMHLADIFSRACIKDVRNENLKYDVYPIDIIYKEIATVNVMETLSVCSDTVLRIREETSSDPIMCEVKKLILNGWPPNKNQTSMLTREY